jgi:ABC-type nitrate/sulfonate/bicarbonate transport system ATPase subunit
MATLGPPAGGPLLDVRSVSLRYRDASSGTLDVLRDVSLHVNTGEFVALIGPSGSGKTSLLSLIAGLEEPASGEIALHGDIHASRLGHVGYMPQRDLLLPWRTALDNATAGLEARGVPKAEARERARTLFQQFGLMGFERSWPAALSGGMRQRVAFARAVLAGGELLLLDEPFGALDALTRQSLQRWLAEMCAALGLTCLLVTHDLDEALFLAGRVYVLGARPGRVLLERSIPAPRPRTPETLLTPEMAALKGELRAALLGSQEDMQEDMQEGAAAL